jgi:hypothetical protein
MAVLHKWFWRASAEIVQFCFFTIVCFSLVLGQATLSLLGMGASLDEAFKRARGVR